MFFIPKFLISFVVNNLQCGMPYVKSVIFCFDFLKKMNIQR